MTKIHLYSCDRCDAEFRVEKPELLPTLDACLGDSEVDSTISDSFQLCEDCNNAFGEWVTRSGRYSE